MTIAAGSLILVSSFALAAQNSVLIPSFRLPVSQGSSVPTLSTSFSKPVIVLEGRPTNTRAGANCTHDNVACSTARPQKVAFLQNQYTAYHDRVVIFAIDDLIHADYTAALKGVVAIIHIAAPLSGRAATQEEQIDVRL